MASNNKYTSEQIIVLEGLQPVRKRPAMYIGSTDTTGLHHCLTEIIDNSIDEALAGFAKNIWIIIHPDNSATVADDGRGIPIDIMPKYKKPALEVIMTTLHSGGKFEGTAYKVSGGLHGVGAACVSALSSDFQVEIRRNGKIHYMDFCRGKVKTKLSQLPKTKVKLLSKILPKKVDGTTTTFTPDPQIFKETLEFSRKTILKSLKNRAYLTSKIYFHFYDERNHSQKHFYFEGGIISLLRELNKKKEIVHPPIYIHGEQDGVDVEVAIQYNDTFKENITSFVNIINTHEGGSHLTGFKMALTRTIKDYSSQKDILKNKNDNITGDDTREGLTAIISIKMSSKDLQFEGQTKGKLGNSEVQPIVAKIVRQQLSTYFEENPAVARAIVGKSMLAIQIRKAAKAAKDAIMKKGLFDSLGLPGKLADCQSKNPQESELFIVEGDSAGGCFSANTKVALTDGRNLNFKELIKENRRGKKNYCYSINKQGSIGISPIINPRLTKKKTSVIKIILDNKEKIICTPEHLFMLRNGSYKQASKLTVNDSLMPLKTQLSRIGKRITIKGYQMIFDPGQHRWLFTHVLADGYNLETRTYTTSTGNHRHHIDFNKLNNNPENLTRLPNKKHLDLHRQHAKKTLHTPEVKAKLLKLHQTIESRNLIRKKMTTPKMRLMLSQMAKKLWSEPALLQWRRQKTKQQWTSEFRKKRKATYNQTYLKKALFSLHQIYLKSKIIDKLEYEKLRKTTNDKSLLRHQTICQRFFQGNEKAFDQAIVSYNHRIKQIIPLTKKVDVYDIEVPITHNFALASGIFVHNSAKQGRDRKFQAILPLWGKAINTENMRLDKIVASVKLKDLIIALGMGIGETIDVEKLRYHHIILMSDADVDGAHISTLLLTFLFRHMPYTIEQGHVYLSMPPLYKIKQGKISKYVYTEEEKEKYLKTIDLNKKYDLQRYKGLGEMNPKQLWDTTMNPATRTLKKITILDAQRADETFSTLMSKDVPPRKKFIQTHAHLATLDI